MCGGHSLFRIFLSVYHVRREGMCKLIIVERLDVISARNWAVT